MIARISLLLLAGFLAGAGCMNVAPAPELAQNLSCVWKVTKGDKVLYLGGTFHLLRKQDYPLPPQYDLAYAGSTKLVFEMDPGPIQTLAAAVALVAKSLYSDDMTLQKALTPEAWKAVLAYCAASNLDVTTVNKFKPWFFLMMLEAQEMQKLGMNEQGVDEHFYKKAVADHKKTGALESLATQIDVVTSLAAGHESEIITSEIKDMDKSPLIEEQVIAAWRAGDVEKLDGLTEKDQRDNFPAIYANTLTHRNQAWEPEIEALLQSPDTVFVLVGAAHLSGPDSVLNQLRKDGYGVEQIKLPLVTVETTRPKN